MLGSLGFGGLGSLGLRGFGGLGFGLPGLESGNLGV